MKGKVLTAMSGGVDSSVGALLLKEAGFEVVGLTMCLGIKDTENDRERCCGQEAIDDARRICDKLRIPHYVMDFSKDLEDKVISKFIDEYNNGRTPNPCIDCNRYLKFDNLIRKAFSMDFDYFATGHYAKIDSHEGQFFLKKAKDRTKDQTYFLYTVKYDYLKSILFPLGDYTKDEVREIASKANLHVADKPQSQDICFIPGKNYRKFIEKKIDNIKPGLIVDINGNTLGNHKGIVFFTIGQRGGMGISSANPLYVISIDTVKNEITAGEKKHLKATGLYASDLNLLVDNLPQQASAKIRYAHRDAECNIFLEYNKLKVIFDKKQEAITPGQSVVFYSNDIVLGGGIIDEVIR